MWSSDEDSYHQQQQQQQQRRRAGKAFEDELQLRYLSPGAFTILPPDVQGAPPDSPPVINNYRLTPTARRNRNAAFSIIAESNSNPGSRSPSPSGRVSPFRGRGFNPIGSRHASPAPSPRHEDHHQQKEADPSRTRRSKIPTRSRRDNNVAENSVSGLPPRAQKTATNLVRQYSKSMTNVSPKQLGQKKKLSPIVGSSPDRTPASDKSKSSPSKIPRSRSQPPAPRSSAATSGTNSKSNSKNPSREPSPIKIPKKNNYQNVKAKVNSFNTNKPKVPPKPQVPTKKLEKKDSKVNVKQTSGDNNNSSSSPSKGRTKGDAKNQTPDQIQLDAIERDALSSNDSSPKKNAFAPSSTVVSSTTAAAAGPLKIDAENDKDDNTDYLSDVRALSATSVSTALNRMNDTVLDTKTLIKETTIASRIPPTVASTANTAVNSPANSNDTTHHQTPKSPMGNTNNNNNNVEGVNTNGRAAHPHQSVVGINALPKSANDRIREARTLVATDVQPIRILVKEKPSNPEVQSGNFRLSVGAANGIGERPGLPPPQSPQQQQQQQQQQQEEAASDEPPKGICGRFFGRFKKQSKKDAKRRWWFSRKKTDEAVPPSGEDNVRWWRRLQCCKRKKVGDVEAEDGLQRKDSWAERRESQIDEPPKLSSKNKCKDFLRTICCLNLCSRKKRKEEEAIRRRESMMSKKKSLTPLPTIVEEPQTSKLDAGLVDHTSVMKAAIPVLPVPLAWLCLILNVFVPGLGTIVSGFLCLCIGKPRFSQKDGPKPRIGACIIDFFIGCGQLFTVLFCLVGWGWSIWWGVIMLKLARKYRKVRRAEKAMEEEDARMAARRNHLDAERGV